MLVASYLLEGIVLMIVLETTNDQAQNFKGTTRDWRKYDGRKICLRFGCAKRNNLQFSLLHGELFRS